MKKVEYDYNLFSSLFNYDAESGVITRRVCCGSQPKGKIPGSLDRDGYIKINVYGRTFFAHRICWLLNNGDWPSGIIDHINGRKDDNRICNLRVTDKSGNGKNQRITQRNSSGCVGVVWNKTAQKWQSQIKECGKDYYLGVFDNKFDAMCARKSAERRLGFSEDHGNSQQTEGKGK